MHVVSYKTHLCASVCYLVNVTEIGVPSQVSTDIYGVPMTLRTGTS